MKKIVSMAISLIAAGNVLAAGFGIYEASTRGNAMGGALVADTQPDASANYYNAANTAFATNIQVTVGATFINPFYDPEVNHVPQNRMNAGWFTAPNFYFSVPLPADLTFGWGNYTEYGLGSRYAGGWDLANDTKETTMRQVTLNPNLAYKITDKWSIAAGPRVSWISFSNDKQPFYKNSTLALYGAPANLYSHLEGEDWSIGWTASTLYKITDDWSIGFVYRSPIRHNIRGHFDMTGDPGLVLSGILPTAIPYHSSASARLTLPESYILGSNYNVTDRYRVGTAITWTRWSSIREINFNIPNYGYTQAFHWKDTPRVSFGMEYDLLTWMQVRCGYVFDRDPSKKSFSTTMLPPGDRHIIATGLGFKLTENLRFDLGFSLIRMNNQHYRVTGTALQETKYFSCHNGFSYLVSANISYSF